MAKDSSILRFAGVEAGGTTWVVAIAEGDPTNIVDREEFSTSTPSAVLGNVVGWLKLREFDCLGVASFGPIDLHAESPQYGFITTTPKPGWKNTDILGPLRKGLGLPDDFPLGFDTDVNAPAMAEFKESSDSGLTSCAYITVGTGVGVGLVFNGHPLHGLLHGEGGHISVPVYPARSALEGIERTKNKRYSLDCPTWFELESMCNSAALADSAGCSIEHLKDLSDDHPVWDEAAHYLACLCANLILLVSPEKIVLGGGVLKRQILFSKIRAKTQTYLNSYINVPAVVTLKGLEELIVPSKHGNNAGMVGALFLAKLAYEKRTQQVSTAISVHSPMNWSISSFTAGIAVASLTAFLLFRR